MAGSSATTKTSNWAGGARRSAALLSLTGAIAILALKFGAYALTGSIGLLSDAAESLVNLVAAVVLITGAQRLRGSA